AENKRRAQVAAAAAAKKSAAATTAAAAAASKNGDGGVSRGQSGAIGNGSGGTTGLGGSGGRPGGSGGNDWGGVDWVCPTGTAAVGFSDTWGAPRSGGRRHEGVDMIGKRGTPILAVVDGVARPSTNELGGNTIWFVGDDGNSYYYAHLDSWAKLGQVQKGDVIGILGDTGNAKLSTPHLHFEIHPNHGDAVDPYPTVRAHC
ncbi:MAG: M23 family metallopeptidase, partial [Actinomycetota bacterium]